MYRSTDSTHPIVCLQGIGVATQGELDDATCAFDRALARSGLLLCISDSRRASHDAKQRRLIAEWADTVTPRCQKRMIGTIVILDSALIRGALTALNWLSREQIPQYMAADGYEAVAIGRKLAEKANLTVSAETWGRVGYWLEQGAKYK
jgi:hypothetical protein